MKTLVSKYIDYTKIDTSFSFAPFYQFLRKRASETNDAKKGMLEYFADQIEEAGVHERDISDEELPRYKELLDILYVSFTNITLDGNKDIWGITAPFTRCFAYGTPSLYNSFIDEHTAWLKPEFESNFREISLGGLKNIYQTILHQVYNISFASQEDFIYRYIDPQTGLYRFYKIIFDHRFIDIKYEQHLPELNEHKILGITDDALFVRYMLRKLPLSLFRFRGFGIVSIADVTEQQSILHIKERLLKLKEEGAQKTSIFEDLRISVKSLLGSNKIEISLPPFTILNKKIVWKTRKNLLGCADLSENEIQTFFNLLETHKKPIVINDTQGTPARYAFLEKLLRNTPYRTYAVVPIFFQQKVYGALELFSVEPGVITPERIRTLERLNLEFAQLMRVGVELFEHDLRQIISERFTVIQPSIAWKFDEAALEYLIQERTHGKVIRKVPIVFESIYPFYGAVDIRNSSLLRNNAIRADWQLQLKWLQKTANELKPFGLPYVQQLMQQQTEFLKDNNIDRPISSETISLSHALDKALYQLLQKVMVEHPQAADICKAYLDAIDPVNGPCSINRRNLELSMQQTVAGIDNLLNEMNKKMQQVYPAYYNKFRTDGIEYDIYVGQSINPQKPFTKDHLHQLHIIQLEYMRKIALLNAEQQHSLLVPLQSTQLIFVNSDVIDITFREDEKRFDVEGAYNIHYQMIKKRVDKVHIRDTKERLTQPGKIAIIYINEADVEDYVDLLHAEIKRGHFSNLEYLLLEDLQGISGLKALRVTVAS